MATISDAFTQAQLAEAAYVNLWDSNANTVISDPNLVQSQLVNLQPDGSYDFSPAQAAEFVKNWKVVDQFTAPTSLVGLIGSGFSATVFERLDPTTGQGTGEYTFAVRGSEGTFTDWVNTNFGDVGADGIAIDQGIEMYNYYLRLTGAPRTQVPQYEYVEASTVLIPGQISIPAHIQRIADAAASSWLSGQLAGQSGQIPTIQAYFGVGPSQLSVM